MDSCDILVVGGGPGGSSCARELRWAGFDVVVMDKRSFPRTKVCAGWITPGVVESLKLDTEHYARERVLQPITGFRIAAFGSKQHEFDYKEVLSYGLLRREFDDYLLQRCGARLRLGEAFKSAVRVGDRWRVNNSLETRLIVGAGGHFCPVARMLGAGKVSERVVAAQEVEFEMTAAQIRECKVRPEAPELFFLPDLKGYAWCFRKGNHLNVGFGRENAQALTEQSHQFMRYYKGLGRIPQDAPEKFSGHAYIMYGHTQRELIGDGSILIGDAAGLAYADSGEGILTAVESGLMAAETIRAANGDYSRSKLEPYLQSIARRYGKPRPAVELSPFSVSVVRVLFKLRWAAGMMMDFGFGKRQAPLIANSRFVEPQPSRATG